MLAFGKHSFKIRLASLVGQMMRLEIKVPALAIACHLSFCMSFILLCFNCIPRCFREVERQKTNCVKQRMAQAQSWHNTTFNSTSKSQLHY
eukprot:784828-Amphidinium_carterae.1